MITAIIVISSVVLAAIFTFAWLTNPALRQKVEQPKFSFQESLQQHDRSYNSGLDIDHMESGEKTDESR